MPEGARVVDGNGKYLIPGLWDMHAHTAGPSFLPLYLANGVTGVRDMHALDPDAIFGLREQVQEGKQPGPRMVAAGPLVDGPKPLVPGSLVAANAEEGREAVRKLKKTGADFVKVYTNCRARRTSPSPTRRRSRASSLPGTSPRRSVPSRRPTPGQKSIEHLTGVEPACSNRQDELRRRHGAVKCGQPGTRRRCSDPRPVRSTPSTKRSPRTCSPASPRTAPGTRPP